MEHHLFLLPLHLGSLKFLEFSSFSLIWPVDNQSLFSLPLDDYISWDICKAGRVLNLKLFPKLTHNFADQFSEYKHIKNIVALFENVPYRTKFPLLVVKAKTFWIQIQIHKSAYESRERKVQNSEFKYHLKHISFLIQSWYNCEVKVAQSRPTLQRHGLYSPWNSPGQNTGEGSCSLLQIFPTQGSNPGFLHCRWTLPSESPAKPKNTGVGSLSLLQQTFLTQAIKPGSPALQAILYQLSYQGSSDCSWYSLAHSSPWLVPSKLSDINTSRSMFIFSMWYKSLGMIQERQIFLCKTMQHLSTTGAHRERNIFSYHCHYNHKRITEISENCWQSKKHKN